MTNTQQPLESKWIPVTVWEGNESTWDESQMPKGKRSPKGRLYKDEE